MQIELISQNIEITPRVKKLLYEKLGEDVEKHLPKLNEDIKTATVSIRKHTRWGYKVSFTMWLPQNYQIFAEERGERLLTTMVCLRDELIRQIEEYKGRLKK